MKVWILLAICGPWLAAATHEIHPDRHSRVFSAHEHRYCAFIRAIQSSPAPGIPAARIRLASGTCSSLTFIRRLEIH